MPYFSVTKCKEISEVFPTYTPYINCEGCQCGTNAVCKNRVCQCQSGFSGDPFVSCQRLSDKIEILVDCPNEENFKTINGVCYLFHGERKNYNDAKSFCESKTTMAKRGRLIEPKTTTINKLIYNNANIVHGGWFIGVNDISSEGTWVYSSSSTVNLSGQ